MLNEVVTGDGRGDAARLRKGLLEGRFAVRPGEGCLGGTAVKDRLLAEEGRRTGCFGERFRRLMSYQSRM